MIIIGIIIAMSAFDGETPAMFGYQIIILGSMLFGLGFLAIVIYALLSNKNISEPAHQKFHKIECSNCGATLKSEAKFCGECGTTQS